VRNDNPYSESRYRTVKYRPNYPNRQFRSKEEACLWVSSFVNWYNHQHRHSGIKFVTPQQRHSGEAIAIAKSGLSFMVGIANLIRGAGQQPNIGVVNQK